MPPEEVGSDALQGVWGPDFVGSGAQWLPGADPALGRCRAGTPGPRGPGAPGQGTQADAPA